MASQSPVLEEKLPEEVWLVAFDFTDIFNTGVAITGTPVFTIEMAYGTDAAVASMPTGTPQVLGMIASQAVGDGVPDCRYRLKMKATGSDGSVETITLILPVVAQRLG